MLLTYVLILFAATPHILHAAPVSDSSSSRRLCGGKTTPLLSSTSSILVGTSISSGPLSQSSTSIPDASTTMSGSSSTGDLSSQGKTLVTLNTSPTTNMPSTSPTPVTSSSLDLSGTSSILATSSSLDPSNASYTSSLGSSDPSGTSSTLATSSSSDPPSASSTTSLGSSDLSSTFSTLATSSSLDPPNDLSTTLSSLDPSSTLSNSATSNSLEPLNTSSTMSGSSDPSGASSKLAISATLSSLDPSNASSTMSGPLDSSTLSTTLSTISSSSDTSGTLSTTLATSSSLDPSNTSSTMPSSLYPSSALSALSFTTTQSSSTIVPESTSTSSSLTSNSSSSTTGISSTPNSSSTSSAPSSTCALALTPDEEASEMEIPFHLNLQRPWLSIFNAVYMPMGSLNTILPDSYNNLSSSGDGYLYPRSNDYGIGVGECASTCASNPPCASFNIFTVATYDENGCLNPIYECRFSANTFNSSDYTESTESASYAWSTFPDCTNSPLPTDTLPSGQYVSYAGITFLSEGLQAGILPINSLDLDGGPSDDLLSYTYPTLDEAMLDCARWCSSLPTCLVINIYIAFENDVNNCIPAYQCRFSESNYSPLLFSEDYGTPSYAFVTPCGYPSADLIPSDIPTANPYTSPGGYSYYPMGNQGDMALPSSYNSLVVNNTESNSYTLAVQECSAACDSYAGCVSFNIFTVTDPSVHNCSPFFECRFSNNFYDYQDYTLNISRPSYAWSLPPLPTPNCDFSSGFISGADWVSQGMDTYLQDVAGQKPNLISDNTDFTVQLMARLGDYNYECLSYKNAPCTDVTPITTCADWVNRNIANFELFMNNAIDILDTLQLNLMGVGDGMYDDIWYTPPPTPPASSSFNPLSLIFDLLNGALTLIVAPELKLFVNAGKFGIYMGNAIEAATAAFPTTGSGGSGDTGPVEQDAWDSFLTIITGEIVTAIRNLQDLSGNVTMSDAILTDVLNGGNWSVSNMDDLLINSETAWENTLPYYTAKVAMQGMQAQSIFLMSVNVPGCTQAIADTYASWFQWNGESYTDIAFCYNSNQVIIPVVGWQSSLYTPFPNLVQVATVGGTVNITNSDIYKSASSCLEYEMGYTYPTPEDELNINLAGISIDSTGPCIWNFPVCVFEDQYPELESELNRDDYNDRPQMSPGKEQIYSTASYFAKEIFNLPTLNICGYVPSWGGTYCMPWSIS